MLRFSLLILLCAASGHFAAANGADGNPIRVADRTYRVTRWTSESGLPQNTVRRLFQTRDGYLWIGTLYGLARFDGLHFKVFAQMNTPAMASDAIDVLAEDTADASLWVGTGDGLLRHAANQFERCYPLGEKLRSMGRVWPANGGGVWLQGEAGALARWRNTKLETWKLPPPYGLAGCAYLEEETPGQLLALAGEGLVRLDLRTGHIEHVGPPATSHGHTSACRDGSGRIWVTSVDRLWVWDRRDWTLAAQNPSGRDPLTRVLATREGVVWIGLGEQGLHQLKDGQLVGFPGLSGPGTGNILDMIEDTEGNLWAGTGRGLFRLQPHRIRTYTQASGLHADDVLTLAAAPDGTVWVGSGDRISGIRHGVATPLPPVDSTNGHLSPTMTVDGRGRLRSAMTATGIATWTGDRWSLDVLPPQAAVLGRVRFLCEDREGRLWGGCDRGAFVQEGDRWTTYTTTNGLSQGDIRLIHQDRRGDTWFGTYGGGLNRLHDGVITAFATTNGIYNNRAWWIHEDADGIFWVASQNGLNRFAPPGLRDPIATGAAEASRGTSFTLTTRHGLRENVVNNIQEDAFGHLWLSGLRGIYRVSRHELNEVAAGRRPEVSCVAFGDGDGMFTSECNGGEDQPSGCRDVDGRIYFPTGGGVVAVDPSAIELNDLAPQVVVEQVLADDEILWGDGVAPGRTERNGHGPQQNVAPGIALPAGRGRVLEVHYTANSFADPARVQFKFRLEGYETGWRHDRENRRTAFYTNLRPGSYRFHVKACNNHGIWNETGATFAFSVAPFFWQTWSFAGLCAVALFAIAAAVQATRLRWQRRLLELDAQRALANERTRIARDLHDDLGTALTGLALELDVIRGESHPDDGDPKRLAEAAGRTRDLAERMREVVWAINPRCDTVLSLASFLEQQAGHLLRSAGIGVRFDFPEDIPVLPIDAEARHQLSLGVREALTNVIRHASASEVTLRLKVEPGAVRVEVSDNGRGFDPIGAAKPGHGLENLQHRLERLGGCVGIQSSPGEGTTIRFSFSFTPSRPKDTLIP